jgi:hypothetical protein
MSCCSPWGVEKAEVGLDPWMVRKRLSLSFRDLISEAGNGIFCGSTGKGWLSSELVSECAKSLLTNALELP